MNITIILRTTLLLFTLLCFSTVYGQNEPPTANCLGNAVATPIFQGQTRVIHAGIFNKNSYDAETADENLRYAFSSDPADSLLVLDCDDIDSIKFTFYVFDEAGAYDSCYVQLNIDDQCSDQQRIQGVTDTIAPTIFIADEMSLLTLDSVSFNTIQAKDFNVRTYDNVSRRFDLRYTFSPDPLDTTFSYHCDDKVTFNLTIYVTDEAGNRSHCRTSITIDTTNCNSAFIQDTIPPVVKCIGSYDLSLNADGEAVINAEEIDDGTYDGDYTTPVDRLRFSFDLNNPDDSILEVDCDDLGESQRTFYAWDHEGNVDSCTFTLTVSDPLDACYTPPVDTIPPTAECVALIELSLQGDSTILVKANQLNNGSIDNLTPTAELQFSFSTDTSDNELILSCKDLGVNEVQLVVTDTAGISSTCTSVINLTDPDGLCAGDTTSLSSLIQDGQWKIFPNPFNSDLTIEGLPIDKGVIQLSIFNIRGREVFTQIIRQAKVTIHPNLVPGNYLIKFIQEGKLIGVDKISRLRD